MTAPYTASEAGSMIGAPKIVGIAMVKNEQDVIEPFVRHNLRFLDHLIVLDNGSVDETRTILGKLAEELPRVVVADDAQFGYTQSEKMTFLMRECQKALSADYIVPLDADEFLSAPDRRSFESILAAIPSGGYGLVPWRTYVLTPQTAAEAVIDPPRSMRWRRSEELPPFWKAIIRLDGLCPDDLVIEQGNHYTRSTGGRTIPEITLEGLHFLHFPVRSQDQLTAKSVVGWMAYLARDAYALERGQGGHWRINCDRIARGESLDAEALCEMSLMYAQDPREIAWQKDVVEDPAELHYERRYSSGQSLGSTELIVRSWQQSLVSAPRTSTPAQPSAPRSTPPPPPASAKGDVSAYYQGLNEKLFAAIPAAHKVLELGCAAGRLGEEYKRRNPQAVWVGVDMSAEALQLAATRLDATHLLNLDSGSLDALGTGFDCVVFGDLLEHLKQPERLLRTLAEITTPDATLVCCVPNMGHISVVERMLMGDISYENEGLLDRTHLRFFSVSALFKMLLDAGWLPNLHDQYSVGHPNQAMMTKLLEAAATVGVPAATARNYLQTYQAVVRCSKRDFQGVCSVPPKISFVVAVNNDAQFSLNIASAPGVREIGAEVIACRGAANASEALAAGVARATGEWIVFCHQDVYFPAGSGHELAKRLAAVPSEARSRALFGFAGLALDAQGAPLKSGLTVDRTSLFDFPASASVISLDELAVVISRGSRLKIDPALGWHLWATDLCLQSLFDPTQPAFAETLRVPIFHNSYNDFQLPATFEESARKLRAKYPQLTAINTLCGTIQGEVAPARNMAPAATSIQGTIPRPPETVTGEGAKLVAVADRSVKSEMMRLLGEGKVKEAVQCVEAALAAGESAELWNDWATIHAQNGDGESAEKAYMRALELDPWHRDSAVNFGLMLLALGRIQDAVPLLERHGNSLTADERKAIGELAARAQGTQQSQSAQPSPTAPPVVESVREEPAPVAEDNSPKLSIVMPTNRSSLAAFARVLDACECADEDVEVIVRDNSGNEDKRNILSRVSRPNCKIEIVEPCTGKINIEEAIKMASGQFVFWVADDDVLPLKAIRPLVDVIRKQGSDPEVAGITGSYIVEDCNGTSLLKYPPLDSASAAKRVAEYLSLPGANLLNYAVVRRPVLGRMRAFMDAMPLWFSFSDLLMVLMYLVNGKFANVGRAFYEYDSFNWDTPERALQSDLHYYRLSGMDGSLMRIQWLICGLQGVKIAQGKMPGVLLSAEERQGVANHWFNNMNWRFQGTWTRTDPAARFDRETLAVCQKWLQRKEFALDELLLDLTELIALSDRQKAEKYYEFWKD